jgi:hypothetical protein
MTNCVPAVKENGEIVKNLYGMKLARKALVLREGPRPFENAICRHLCENDSMMKNGFICTLHTTWGTYSENKLDSPSELRSEIGKKARAKSSGNKTGNGGHHDYNARPDANHKTYVTCPHCGITSNAPIMARWHFDKCKQLRKLGEAVPQPD